MDKPAYYIADQGWSLLLETEEPQRFLHAALFRPGRSPSRMPGPSSAELAQAWMPINDHSAVLENRLLAPDLRPVELSRLCVTTDAGMGKTCVLDWLCAGLNRATATRLHEHRLTAGVAPIDSGLPREQGWLAFNVPPKVIMHGTTENVHDRVHEFMCKKVEVAANKSGCSPEAARQVVDCHRRLGKLLILCDALDQISDADALAELLTADFWKKCHFVLAGRPYSLQRYWSKLFSNSSWRFLRVEELSEEQQRRYLGRDEAGDLRYEKYIPKATRETLAREILSVPRVMKYLHKLPNDKLKTVRTSADVYYLAICELVTGGMSESQQARRMNCDSATTPEKPQYLAILKALELLGAIAVSMVSEKIPFEVEAADGSTEWQQRPNFFRVERSVFPEFTERLKERFKTTDFQRDWSALSALNAVLTHAVFEEGVDGFAEVEFRNRSLQEFLCAYYLSRHARSANQSKDLAPNGDRLQLPLWDWVYLPLEPETEDYYYVWQFLCEMHHDAVNPESWIESIAPLYSRARPLVKQTGVVSWLSKRSSEMIFRSWPILQQLCTQKNTHALEVRRLWWSEFEDEILSGNRGRELQATAFAFQADLLEIPSGKFWMGTPAGKKRQVDHTFLAWYKIAIDDASKATDQDEYIKTKINSLDWGVGRGLKQKMQQGQDILKQVLNGGGMALVKAIFSGRTNEYWHEVPIANPFMLGRSPCINAWYRLFDSQHGYQTLVSGEYKSYSPDNDCPAIYVDWYSAWAFCMWARWQGQSCHLPSESQWEYACKFGTDPTWDYWWGDDFKENFANALNRLGKTAKPAPAHANPATKKIDTRGDGLMDMLGNVWEWTQNVYRQIHDPKLGNELGEPSVSRVSRGGAFYINADLCRSAYRIDWLPEGTYHSGGFRVARG